MEEQTLLIQSLSETSILLEDARKATIKAYTAFKTAKELEDTIRFQLQADLARYGQQTKNNKENE